MLKYNIDFESMSSLKGLLGSNNEISVLKDIPLKETLDSDKEELISKGILNADGSLKNELQDKLDILANPYGVVKCIFSGGDNIYEHSISYDATYQQYIQFSKNQEVVIIDGETSSDSIVNLAKDFIGTSSIKGLDINYKLDVAEALVVSSMIDMERKALLRAFVDEIAYNKNSYNVNVIWRIVNSTNPSIQWFVHLINQIVGNQEPLTQNQVRGAINSLLGKGIILNQRDQHLLSDDVSLLSNRMAIVDNVMSVQTYKMDNEGVVNSGFTCVQAGIHDMIMFDYDGEKIHIETITAARLIEYLEMILDSKTYFNNMKE